MGLFGRSIMLKMVEDVEHAHAAQDAISEEVMREITNAALATAALSVYAAASDGSISLEEYMDIDINVGSITQGIKLSDQALEEISKVYDNHNITWDEVVTYLDRLPAGTIRKIAGYLDNIVQSDQNITEEEAKVVEQYGEYVQTRL